MRNVYRVSTEQHVDMKSGVLRSVWVNAS